MLELVVVVGAAVVVVVGAGGGRTGIGGPTEVMWTVLSREASGGKVRGTQTWAAGR